MSGRLRDFISSRAFVLILALAGILLLTWPLASVAAGEGTGQFLYIFGVWAFLIVGAAAWGLTQPPGEDGVCAGQDGGEEGACCPWPPGKGDSG
jgi:hypothetical protein